MKIHNKLIKSKAVTEKTDFWGNFITTILTRTGLHTKSCTLNPLKTSLTLLCFRARQALRREENKAMKSFEGSFRNLKFSPFTNIPLNFFFAFIDIKCFFSQI